MRSTDFIFYFSISILFHDSMTVDLPTNWWWQLNYAQTTDVTKKQTGYNYIKRRKWRGTKGWTIRVISQICGETKKQAWLMKDEAR